MRTHHNQLTAAAAEHRSTIRASHPTWIEMRRGNIDLSFSFRADGQLIGGDREDRSTPAGYTFTDSVRKSTPNRFNTAIAWITAEATEPIAVNLDAPAPS